MEDRIKIKTYSTNPLACMQKLSLPTDEWSAFIMRNSRHAFQSRAFWRAYFYGMPDDLPLFVCEARDDAGHLVALLWGGVVVRKAHRFIKERRLVAYRSGIDSVDKVWPEMNAVLKDEKCEVEDAVLLKHWHKQAKLSVSEWHAIIKGSISHNGQVELIEKGGIVDLTNSITPKGSIGRAIRQTEKYSRQHFKSALSIKRNTGENAWHTLNKHAVHHVEKWKATSTPSGFSVFEFRAILRRWICAIDSNVAVYEVTAGDKSLGVVVIIEDVNEWRFYLSSFEEAKKGSNPNHYHVGYWAHQKIMEMAKEKGVKGYDFMAGDERYKVQFSKGVTPEYCREVHRTSCCPTFYQLSQTVYDFWKAISSRNKK